MLCSLFTIGEFCRVFGLCIEGPILGHVLLLVLICIYICVMARLISTVITADFVGCNYRVFLFLGMNLNRSVCAVAYNRLLCIVAL